MLARILKMGARTSSGSLPHDTPSYLILGAGIFGASTAYHLIKKHPNASITLVDRSLRAHEAAASWDWQKIIRVEYEDRFQMGLAIEA